MRRIGTTDIKVKERQRERKKERKRHSGVARAFHTRLRLLRAAASHDVHGEGKCQEIYIKLNRDGAREERERLNAFLVAYPVANRTKRQ